MSSTLAGYWNDLKKTNVFRAHSMVLGTLLALLPTILEILYNFF